MRKPSNKLTVEFDEDWLKYWKRLSEDMKVRIRRKIDQIIINPEKRHLKHGLDFFVAEVGQYRIVYRFFKRKRVLRFYFVGKHKDYERWYHNLW